MKYQVQEHLKPRGLTGISDEQIEQYWHLYEAYAKNTNELLEEIETAFLETVSWERSWSNAPPLLDLRDESRLITDHHLGDHPKDPWTKVQYPDGIPSD
jgi:asparagine synthetase B (glutamine-hydrolysing)